jgi:hypothetical protein
MVIVNPEFLFNVDSEVHLRDARHAHNFYVQHNHAFSPKVKFLYHVVFDLKDEFVRSRAPNSNEYKKQIAVLAKTVDLPSFKAQVDVKQQYNRKKNVQTRIDYDEINMKFHDDNVGITRTLLEEYYRHYFMDGNKNDGRGFPLGFEPRDAYRSLTHKYGMDNNNVRSPFFGYIKIFQLSRQKWHSYTLINPLLTTWSHDTLDYGDSQTMENSITVAYEGVLYNFGDINSNGDPAGFADQETAYDQVHSPLNTQESAFGQSIIGSEPERFAPKLNNEFFPPGQENLFNIIRSSSPTATSVNQFNTESNTGIQQILFPFTDTQNLSTSTRLATGRVSDSDTIVRELQNDPELLDSVVAKAVGIGLLNSEEGPFNLGKILTDTERNAAQQQIISAINSNNKRALTLASSALRSRNERNLGI